MENTISVSGWNIPKSMVKPRTETESDVIITGLRHKHLGNIISNVENN